MHTEKVTCDGCGADLTVRTNSVDYRLVLASESKPGYGSGVYTDMMIYPAIKRTHHFCGIACLDHWRDREKHKTTLWREWWKRWKEEHGRKYAGGISYPQPSQETTEPLEAEFEAAAIAAFPMKHPVPQRS